MQIFFQSEFSICLTTPRYPTTTFLSGSILHFTLALSHAATDPDQGSFLLILM